MDFSSPPLQWTKVILIRTRQIPCTGLSDARQVPARPYFMPVAVSTLMVRPDFLQYLAYHRPILHNQLAYFSVTQG